MHAPNLHGAAALGVEVDELAIRRIFGAVVEAFRGGEARFGTAGSRNRVDVKVAVALADERQCFSVRRPSMPVTWTMPWFGDAFRRATRGRNDIHDGVFI